MKYITNFETQAAYNAAESSLALPNVSYIEETNSVAYKPYVPLETRVVAKFNVTSTSSPTQITGQYISSSPPFSEIEIDGVVQPSVVNAYTFSTTGEHTVKYTLTDQTIIGQYAFVSCSGLTSIDIPNSVTSIGYAVFGGCSGLTSCTIGNSVTSIDNAAFQGCSSLTSITSLATTAPTISSNTFKNVHTSGTLTVPSGSSGYDVWMGTGDYYLGLYNWTKVEQ